jgi:hypothetical protein
MAIFSTKDIKRKTKRPAKRTRVPIDGLKWDGPTGKQLGDTPYKNDWNYGDKLTKKNAPKKRKVPKSRLGSKLKQRLRKLLRNRRKTARKGKAAGRRQRRTGKGEGIVGHAAIIDGKNWDGSRNNPRANARRERQRTRRKPATRGRGSYAKQMRDYEARIARQKERGSKEFIVRPTRPGRAKKK